MAYFYLPRSARAYPFVCNQGEIAAKIRTSRTRSSLEIQIEHFVHIIAYVAVGVGCLSLVANIMSPRKRSLAEVLERNKDKQKLTIKVHLP